jgi:antirestriction protein ArdC
MHINKNHSPAVQFVTLAHELGHLFLGHLGADKHLDVPRRSHLTDDQYELEAESVSFIVCSRNGVKSKAETYLANYVKAHTTVDDIDIYQVMRAAGKIETLLGLGATTKYDKPQKGTSGR